METSIKYFVYILESFKDSRFYIGQTNNLRDRLERHNAGYVKATAHRRPLKLIYQEIYNSRSEALRREKYLKNLKNHAYMQSMISNSQGKASRLQSGHAQVRSLPGQHTSTIYKKMNTITNVIGDHEKFLDIVHENLLNAQIDVSAFYVDHIAYRTTSAEDYEKLKNDLFTYAEMLSEKIIRDRRVCDHETSQTIAIQKHANFLS